MSTERPFRKYDPVKPSADGERILRIKGRRGRVMEEPASQEVICVGWDDLDLPGKDYIHRDYIEHDDAQAEAVAQPTTAIHVG